MEEILAFPYNNLSKPYICKNKLKREIMEKLKFWLDELDLIAKEFNREYEQLCKEHLTRLQKINMELDEGIQNIFLHVNITTIY